MFFSCAGPGQHALDIGAGIVPLPGAATGAQTLLAEGRAWASTLEFLEANELVNSLHYNFLGRNPMVFLQAIQDSYGIPLYQVSDAEFMNIVRNHMSQFPYGGHRYGF